MGVITKRKPPDQLLPNPSGLCMCGCGQSTTIAKTTQRRQGQIAGQPQRYVYGHWSRSADAQKQHRLISIEERFWSKVDKHPDGCWVWIACKASPKGYGGFQIGVRCMRAHRVAYELAFGPIPKGMYVCHHCDNPACVRPDHLFLGTAKDNSDDKIKKGRLGDIHPPKLFGEEHPQSKLTSADVMMIRELYKNGHITQKALAKQFDIHHTHIGRIIRNLYWVKP